MAFKAFEKITPGVKTEHWTIDDPDYNKYVREDDSYFIVQHQKSEADILALGAQEITTTTWATYFARIGGHPPSKPPAA